MRVLLQVRALFVFECVCHESYPLQCDACVISFIIEVNKEVPITLNPQSTKPQYDPFAAIYNRWWGANYHEQCFPVLQRLLLSAMPANARLLDLCCGTAALGAALAARWPDAEIHAADSDPAAVLSARRNLPPERVHEGDLYDALPDDLRGRQCYVVDPMLATGGTLADAIRYLTDRGADDITAVTLLATPEGVKHVEEALADLDIPVTIVTGAMDERLNEKGYIVPGLGDAGDRLYGVV